MDHLNNYQQIYQQEKRILFYLSLIFYCSNILNVFLTIKYFLAGEKTYFIVFWTFFALDKVVSLILTIGSSSRAFLFWVMDVFQLGFIFIYFSRSIPFGFGGLMTTKLFGRVLPLIISEAILFFGTDMISNGIVDNYVIILTYVNFLIFLTLAALLLTYSEQQNRSALQNILKTGSTYLILCSLFRQKDLFQVNLGYYVLIISILSIIIQVIITPKQEKKVDNLVFLFFCGFFMMPTLDFEPALNLSIIRKVVYLSYYLNQYLRFFLLLGFGYSTLFFSKNDQKLDNIIYTINYCLAMPFGLAQIIATFKDFIQLTFQSKIVNIENQRDLLKFTQGYTKSNLFLKSILLSLNLSQIYKTFDGFGLYQPMLQNGCIEQRCQFFYDIIAKISELKVKKIEVIYNQTPFLCLNHMIEVLSQIQYFPDPFVKELQYMDKLLSPETLISILLGRYSNGYLFSTNDFFIEIFLAKQQNVEIKKYYKLVQMNLQIILFQKVTASHMVVSPSQILYDLYGM